MSPVMRRSPRGRANSPCSWALSRRSSCRFILLTAPTTIVGYSFGVRSRAGAFRRGLRLHRAPQGSFRCDLGCLCVGCSGECHPEARGERHRQNAFHETPPPALLKTARTLVVSRSVPPGVEPVNSDCVILITCGTRRRGWAL